MSTTQPNPRRRFLDWFADLGQHPIEAGDHLWFERSPFFYYAFPFHDVPSAEQVARRELFGHRRVLAARFGQQPAGDRPDRSVLWIRRTPYTLDELSSNTRSKVRRGLKNTTVERVEFAALRQAGLELIESTAARQRVSIGRRHHSSWQRTCDVSQRFPFIEAWAGFVERQLAVFAVCFQVEDCFQIWMLRSDSNQLGKYPNNALVHALMEEGLGRPGVSSVCYGFASLDRGTTGLNEFKRSAGFDAEPVDDVIVGRLPILAVRAGGNVLERLASRRHGVAQAATLAKTVGWWRSRP